VRRSRQSTFDFGRFGVTKQSRCRTVPIAAEFDVTLHGRAEPRLCGASGCSHDGCKFVYGLSPSYRQGNTEGISLIE
jgi:hypothetical protein